MMIQLLRLSKMAAPVSLLFLLCISTMLCKAVLGSYKWKVVIVTADDDGAGTDDNIKAKINGPIRYFNYTFSGGGGNLNKGVTDTFLINVDGDKVNLKDLYIENLGHGSPSKDYDDWKCDTIIITDEYARKEYLFDVYRWFGGTDISATLRPKSLKCLSGTKRVENPLAGGKCEKCHPGTVQPGIDKPTCDKCAKGSYQPETGQPACIQCLVGTFKDETGSKTACEPCAPGTYQNKTGQDSCIGCPAGTFQSESGKTQCDKCAKGSYESHTGQPTCMQCPTGTFKDSIGSTTPCDQCLPGTFQNKPGQNTCIGCPAGTSQPDSGQTSCIPCSEGTFQSESGETQCDKCAKGSYQPYTGQSSCMQCPTGTFKDSIGSSTPCDSCHSGTFQNKTGQNTCIGCPVGTFQPVRGKTSCTKCQAGYYKDTTFSTTPCEACASGSYQNKTGQGTCVKCAKGSYQSRTGQSSCTQCQAGYFKDKTGSTTDCDPCSPGTFQPYKGKMSCTKCARGHYQDDEGQPSCKPCPVGHSVDKTGATACQPCPVNHFAGTIGSIACSQCVHGTNYQDQKGQSFCKPEVNQCHHEPPPCQHGGTCVDLLFPATFYCICKDTGYNGQLCQKPLPKRLTPGPPEDDPYYQGRNFSYFQAGTAWYTPYMFLLVLLALVMDSINYYVRRLLAARDRKRQEQRRRRERSGPAAAEREEGGDEEEVKPNRFMSWVLGVVAFIFKKQIANAVNELRARIRRQREDKLRLRTLVLTRIAMRNAEIELKRAAQNISPAANQHADDQESSVDDENDTLFKVDGHKSFHTRIVMRNATIDLKRRTPAEPKSTTYAVEHDFTHGNEGVSPGNYGHKAIQTRIAMRNANIDFKRRALAACTENDEPKSTTYAVEHDFAHGNKGVSPENYEHSEDSEKTLETPEGSQSTTTISSADSYTSFGSHGSSQFTGGSLNDSDLKMSDTTSTSTVKQKAGTSEQSFSQGKGMSTNSKSNSKKSSKRKRKNQQKNKW